MAKKEKEPMEVVSTSGTLTSPLVIPADDVEKTVVVEEEINPNNHPNFIESNTQGITLEELSDFPES